MAPPEHARPGCSQEDASCGAECGGGSARVTACRGSRGSFVACGRFLGEVGARPRPHVTRSPAPPRGLLVSLDARVASWRRGSECAADTQVTAPRARGVTRSPCASESRGRAGAPESTWCPSRGSASHLGPISNGTVDYIALHRK